jgi:hypothetical protein
MTDEIPIVDWHRGVGLHDCQSPERIARVRAAIDTVLGDIAGIEALAAFACDCANPPESRMLAASKIEALWQLAGERREARPGRGLSPADVAAATAGLASPEWRSPTHYASDLDVHTERAVPREVPLPPVPR